MFLVEIFSIAFFAIEIEGSLFDPATAEQVRVLCQKGRGDRP